MHSSKVLKLSTSCPDRPQHDLRRHESPLLFATSSDAPSSKLEFLDRGEESCAIFHSHCSKRLSWKLSMEQIAQVLSSFLLSFSELFVDLFLFFPKKPGLGAHATGSGSQGKYFEAGNSAIPTRPFPDAANNPTTLCGYRSISFARQDDSLFPGFVGHR